MVSARPRTGKECRSYMTVEAGKVVSRGEGNGEGVDATLLSDKKWRRPGVTVEKHN